MWYKLLTASVNSVVLTRQIMPHVRNNRFFEKLCKHYNFPPRDLWRVRFHFGSPDKTTGDDIYLDQSMYGKPVEPNLWAITAAMSRWLSSRQDMQKQSGHDLADGLNWAIAHELYSGRSMEEIETTFGPIFPDHGQLVRRVAEAQRMLR